MHLPDKTVQIEKNDRLIFYFAGHGIVPADGLENTDNLGGYLVPQDARGDILLQKQIEINKILLPMQDLHDTLSELPCRHLLVILDCCFAGAFRSSLYREINDAIAGEGVRTYANGDRYEGQFSGGQPKYKKQFLY